MNKQNGRKKTNTIKTIAVLLAFELTVCLVACGDKTEQAPELLEPVTTTESYRPVEKADVGKRIIKTGYVVPTDYCYFFKTSVTVSKIYVNVGDYVEKGTVLAEADSSETESSIDELNASLSSEQQTHTVNEKIFKQTQKEYDYKIKACEEAGDTEGVKENKNAKAVEAENNRYDNMLYKYKIKKLQQEIDEMESAQTENQLVAEQSGYVTYAKSLTGSDEEGNSSVDSGENIVIISDYSDPYIEITGETITKSGYDIYNIMYTMIDGTRYELEEYSYTNQEIAAAQSTSKLPYVRFKLKDADNASILTTGTLTPLYFSTSTASDALVVGNDSLYEEGDKYFVYVKTDSDDKEKREITIGEQDDNYTEVKNGLSEGELVYYDSDTALPSEYTTYEISLDNFKTTGTSRTYTMVDTNQITYTSPVEGYFTKFELTEGQEVKKGDLLYTVDSGGGSAELLEINSQITSAKEEYDSTVAEYDEQIKSLKKQIKEYKAKAKNDTTDTEETTTEESSTEETTTEAQDDVTENDSAEVSATEDETTEDDTTDETDTEETSEEEEEEENTLYKTEQLTCEIEIAKYNKELAKINYNTTVNPLIKQRDKLNENNDGNGNISVYAESDGVVQTIYASEGYQLNEGDKVVSIGSNESKMMALSLSSDSSSGSSDSSSDSSSSEARLLVNQEVTLIDQDDSSKQLSGRCIGSTSDGQKAYITTIDEQVYITSNASDSEMYYYIQVDDESFYDSPKGYYVSYAKVSLENIVTVPLNIIYDETDKTSGKQYKYVWKMVGDDIVKQYITTGEQSKSDVCVLTGLSEGDLILKESGSASSSSDKSSDAESEEE